MPHDFIEQLVRCSLHLQRAHRVAVDAGRKDIADELRCAAVDVADALALANTERVVVDMEAS